MTRVFMPIFLVAFLLQSCSNTENSSFEDYKRSFYQWNLNYSSSAMFITKDDPLLYDKRFIKDEYVNDIKRFLIELNQIDYKKVSHANQRVYTSIDNFLKNNIYIYESLKFDEWNSLYSVSNFYDHALYIGKLIESNKSENLQTDSINFLISEINFLSNHILFFLENIKYKHNLEIQNATLDRIVKKILNFSSNLLQDEVAKYPNTEYSHSMSKLIISIDKLSNWEQKHYMKLNANPHELSEIKYKKYFHLNSDYKIDFDEIIDQVVADLNKYEKMLFSYSLPIYLETNDEPVWTDFSDTVDVIRSAIDTLENYSYHCSENDKLIKFVNSNIDEIFNSNLYNDINVTVRSNARLDERHDFDFFNYIDDNSLHVSSSKYHAFLFNNYYYTLDKIFPGDFFIYDQISKIGDDFNSIYLNKNFFYGYKLLLIDHYLNTEVSKSDDFLICGTKNSKYLKAIKLFYLRDRIIDAITAIVTIEYFLGDQRIPELINRYDQIGLINKKKNNLLLEEIFGYRMDSIIKFTSINKLKTLIYGMDKTDVERLLRILQSNPNSSLVSIEKLFNK